MPRTPRLESPTGWYHVVNPAARGLRCFGDDADHHTFLAIFGDALDRHRVECHAYAEMPNHFHLVLEGELDEVAGVMKALSGQYAARFNKRYSFDGPLWRGRYLSVPIENDAELAWKIRYVHRNPIEKLEAPASLADFRWTSHLAYLGLVNPPDWLETSHVLSAFGGRDDYRTFVESGDVHDPVPDVDPLRDRSVRFLTPREVEAALGVDSKSERAALSSGGRGVRNELRLACVLLCHELVDRTAGDLADRYGYGSAGGLRSAAHTARDLLETDAGFAGLVEAARQRLRTFTA